MRKPDDRRVKDCDNSAWEPVKLFCAVSESMFVFNVNAMLETPESYIHRPVQAKLSCVHFTRRAGGPVTTCRKVIGVAAAYLSLESAM
jgi:hypothetical protein